MELMHKSVKQKVKFTGNRADKNYYVKLLNKYDICIINIFHIYLFFMSFFLVFFLMCHNISKYYLYYFFGFWGFDLFPVYV